MALPCGRCAEYSGRAAEATAASQFNETSIWCLTRPVEFGGGHDQKQCCAPRQSAVIQNNATPFDRRSAS